MHVRNGVGSARLCGVVLAGVLVVSCVRNPPPVVPEAPEAPPAADRSPSRPAPPPPLPAPPSPTPPLLSEEDDLASRSLENLNRESPLDPIFFEYDSSDLTAQGQGVLQANAGVLGRYPTWMITIEGHCDERGSPEYNLALGERRALAARAYLLEIGVVSDRVRTISYGKEFPFDPGHTEEALGRNRRAHFVITDR